MVEKLTNNEIQQMILEHQQIIDKEVRMPSPKKFKPLPETMMVNDVIVPIKPRDRYLAKKIVGEESYKEHLAETYLKRYNDISHETADYYK